MPKEEEDNEDENEDEDEDTEDVVTRTGLGDQHCKFELRERPDKCIRSKTHRGNILGVAQCSIQHKAPKSGCVECFLSLLTAIVIVSDDHLLAIGAVNQILQAQTLAARRAPRSIFFGSFCDRRMTASVHDFLRVSTTEIKTAQTIKTEKNEKQDKTTTKNEKKKQSD